MRILLHGSVALLLSASLFAGNRRTAPTPPMGWNSWDSYAQSIDEQQVRTIAGKIAQELKPFGWQYVVIDEGWYIEKPEGDPKQYRFAMDAQGRFTPALNRFPSAANGAGFKPLADYVHSLGLKFGVHIIRGIPREAVRKNLPIAGSDFHAQDAADTSDTCPWNIYNYGVRDNAAGQAYYDSLAKLYAAWGVDFIKADCIADHPYKPAEIRMLSEAIRKSGRPMVLSLSPGPTKLEHADEVARYAEMWRVCDDFWDHWGTWRGHEWSTGLRQQFKTLADWAPHIQPGGWPDADMLPLGHLGPHPGAGPPRDTRFTRDEQRTLMTLWAMARSPLMFGGDPLALDDWTRSLLTNRDVIAVDQHSTASRAVVNTETAAVWTAKPDRKRGYYVAVFNLSDQEQTLEYQWPQLGIAGGQHALRDLWTAHKVPKAQSISVRLAPHASVLYWVGSN